MLKISGADININKKIQIKHFKGPLRVKLHHLNAFNEVITEFNCEITYQMPGSSVKSTVSVPSNL
jgi:hypothetical protein